ncbi:hypothetical protein Mapa_011815 [Marchantia paleacea]|nr:hypothetical protein Mapa_011815 [Marchantia paleacea]
MLQNKTSCMSISWKSSSALCSIYGAAFSRALSAIRLKEMQYVLKSLFPQRWQASSSSGGVLASVSKHVAKLSLYTISVAHNTEMITGYPISGAAKLLNNLPSPC